MRAYRSSPLVWTIVTAGVALLLGYIGYRDTMGAGLDRSDAFYRSLQLFAMDSTPEPGSPWELRVARFLAPLSLATAAVLTAVAFLRDHYQRLLIGIFARDHVVVVGLSSSSGSIAESMRVLGERVVVVETDSLHPRLAGLRELGARVVVGDGRQPVTLRRARVDRARHVVVTTGDDIVNLDVADQIRAIRLGTSGRHTTVHVAIDSLGLWLEVGRLTFGRSAGGTSVECFNMFDRTAARMVEAAAAGGSLDRVAVIGAGPLAERAAAHIVRRAQLDGGRVEIMTELDNSVPVALICSQTDALADAIAGARSFGEMRIVVPVESDTADTLLELLGPMAERLHLVPATSTSLATAFLRSSAIEIMARAKHDDYLAQEQAKGLTTTDNPSLLPWDQLPESLRDSNRRFAASVAKTLELVGATLQPLRSESVSELALDPEDLEQLAMREHDRWEADLRADGWTFAAGAKDPMAKTHPLLVPWDQLSEAEREKDRDAIRAIPRMLARVGYAVASPLTP